ncbi:MAG: hypothetical protein AB1414_00125 [bacterium]
MGKELYDYLLNQKYILFTYLFNPKDQPINGQIGLGVVLQDGLSNFKKSLLRFKLMVDLANILEKSVDVTILNDTSPVLRQQTIKSTQPIFVRNAEPNVA